MYYYYYWRENIAAGQSVVGGPIVPTKLCPLCRKTRNAERKKDTRERKNDRRRKNNKISISHRWR